MLEAMAQAAAVQLAHTRGQSGQRRQGMLVVVQNCRVERTFIRGDIPVIAEVERNLGDKLPVMYLLDKEGRILRKLGKNDDLSGILEETLGPQS